MRFYASSVVLLVVVAVAIGCTGMLRSAQDSAQKDQVDLDQAEMVITTPDEVEWQSGPESLPPGAEFAVLEGDPMEASFFNLRLKLPPGYRLPPHTHPKVERVTVLSGTFKFAMGREFEEEELEELTAGSFFVMPPGMAHFAETGDEETIVQLNSAGPWSIDYINPADDPRRQSE